MHATVITSIMQASRSLSEKSAHCHAKALPLQRWTKNKAICMNAEMDVKLRSAEAFLLQGGLY